MDKQRVEHTKTEGAGMLSAVIDFVSAGARQRKVAEAMGERSIAMIVEARSQVEAADKTTRGQLADMDTQRRQAFHALTPGRERLYALAGLADPGVPADDDSARLRTPSFDPPSLPARPPAPRMMAAGALVGAVFGALGAFGLSTFSGTHDPALWGACTVLPAVGGALWAGLLQGRMALAAARMHHMAAQQCDAQMVAYVAQASRIRRAAVLTTLQTTRMGTAMQAKQAELEAVGTDTTNAALLLKDVLNTPLLNEEGAFLQEVIDKLHGQKQRVAAFAAQIDHAA